VKTQWDYETMQMQLPGPVIEASLWLRIGFFSGVSIVAVAFMEFLQSHSGLLLSSLSAVLGAALAVISVRRALALLDRESATDAREGEVAPAPHRALSES